MTTGQLSTFLSLSGKWAAGPASQFSWGLKETSTFMVFQFRTQHVSRYL